MNYHDIPKISQSFLKAFDDDPAKAVGQYLTGTIPRDPPTASMIWGTACERFLIGEGIVEIPADALNAQGHRKGKAWTDFKADHPGESLMTAAELADFRTVKANVEAHLQARLLLFGAGETSVVLEFEIDGEPCKCELDRVTGALGVPVIVDLKTAKSVHPGAWAAQAWSLGYHRQVAWYQDAWRIVHGEDLPFVFVVVKNSPSFSVECFELDEETDFVSKGREANQRSFDRYRRCRDAGQFVSPTHGQITRLAPPRWSRYDNEYEV
jgi:hypothetical protein